MKKQTKKLSLHKETILALSTVTGGVSQTCTQTCATCNQGCDVSTRQGPGCPDDKNPY